jgi:hypothetical protein
MLLHLLFRLMYNKYRHAPQTRGWPELACSKEFTVQSIHSVVFTAFDIQHKAHSEWNHASSTESAQRLRHRHRS